MTRFTDWMTKCQNFNMTRLSDLEKNWARWKNSIAIVSPFCGSRSRSHFSNRQEEDTEEASLPRISVGTRIFCFGRKRQGAREKLSVPLCGHRYLEKCTRRYCADMKIMASLESECNVLLLRRDRSLAIQQAQNSLARLFLPRHICSDFLVFWDPASLLCRVPNHYTFARMLTRWLLNMQIGCSSLVKRLPQLQQYFRLEKYRLHCNV